ncbi:P-loop containing nucleoside triphosphate hydrolase [Sesbania bispinosa]|nr:P-loop containing nucleoside triphosphate hydrolase [Sesbania bispinosa]
MASALVGDDLAISTSSRRSWTSTSFREVWAAPPDAFERSDRHTQEDDEYHLTWAAIERLPTFERMRKGVMKHVLDNGNVVHDEVDVAKLGLHDKKLLIESILKIVEEDNEKFLRRLRDRQDRVGIEIPKIEVRYENLSVEGDVYVGSRALPTLLNATLNAFESVLGLFHLAPSKKREIQILKHVSGMVKPSRLTLLLGPPGSGKTTLLLALSGKLDRDLRASGKVTYCGHELNEFVCWKNLYEMLMELSRREREEGIKPDPEIDAFMKAIALSGQKTSLVTDYVLKILGLDICADIMVGDEMRRGISGGQKKRVTTGEMLVGPAKALFMDEISTGLDSSTTFQICKFMRQMVHIMDVTMVISLLQPAPETFELFDDIILLSEGQIVYQGPRENVLEFFESMGFRCPDRKGVADFLQEVTSKKDQQQYWFRKDEPYRYVSVPEFVQSFNSFHIGDQLVTELGVPYDKRQTHPAALVQDKTKMPVGTVQDGQKFYGALFFTLINVMFNGMAELSMTVFRLPVFYKQRDFMFYPAWAFALPIWILRIPLSLMESGIWIVLTYYTIGFAPAANRFFRQFLALFGIHQMALSLFRFIAAVGRTLVVSNSLGTLTLQLVFVLGDAIKPWMIWGYYISPIMYGQNAIAMNEFLDKRWSRPNTDSRIDAPTVGKVLLKSRGLYTEEYWFWICIGALLGFSLLFNVLFIVALTYLNPLGDSKAVVADEGDKKTKNPLSRQQDLEGTDISVKHSSEITSSSNHEPRRGMVLPFQPLSMAFNHISYYVDMPAEMKSRRINKDRLQLLQDVSGAFRPGILTALVGVSGAGKTTLMDVLAGRKTGGYIEGSISISGYPKNQATFARISGYCEQNDIHSPHVTVYESLLFSAWLRLPADMFVEEVMELVELTPIRDALVGLPGVDGLSTEQRKRLTIAVELVANPSIIFMDEPTSGLDARAAAIVMRTVRNTVDTGRTVLLLMKRGGQVIYAGPLGRHSHKLVEYFEAIPGVPKIKDGYNPATWMLDISTPSVEAQLNVDFAEIYAKSNLYQRNQELIGELSTPAPNSKDLYFPTKYSQSFFVQCKANFWKQHRSYWRHPQYNAVRFFMTILIGVMFGLIFWNQAKKVHKQQDMMNLLGAMYSAVLFLGATNTSSVQPVVGIERTVFYRERAAGMYSALPYAFGQVVIEAIYNAIQTAIYTLILYSMIGFDWKAANFFWFYYYILMSFIYFTLYGMMLVALTPGHQVAAICMSFFFSFWNLFSGFIVPRTQIPIWWRWYYWASPVAWTLYGLITSQLGDKSTEVEIPGAGSVELKEFLKQNLGYHYDFLPAVAAAHVGWVLIFVFVFAYGIKFLNFQKR